MHDTARYCMVLHGFALYCRVLNGIAWYCMVLHGIAWCCIVLLCIVFIAWYCMDIAVVAQKVKVFIEDRCDLKKLGCCCITSRWGWLLELLTELINMYIIDLRIDRHE